MSSVKNKVGEEERDKNNVGEEDNGNGNGNGFDDDDGEEGGVGGKVTFKRKDGVEKDGYICFPVETEGEEEEEKDDGPASMDLGTCPEDPRFQQQNKTKWCYRMYVDYHSCRHLLGEHAKACNYFYRCYNSICPNEWIDKWDQQREENKFACRPDRGCPNLNAKCNEHKPCP